MVKKVFYNEELNTTAEYLEVWQYEIMKVKDVADLLVRNHYWQDEQGELWLDFDDPNENFRHAFDAYRKRKGFMLPTDLRTLRKKLQLSLREFSERLGISYAKVSQIENNKRVQTLSQEIAFRKAEQDYQKQGYLTAYGNCQNDAAVLARRFKQVPYQATIKSTYSVYKQSSQTTFKLGQSVGGIA